MMKGIKVILAYSLLVVCGCAEQPTQRILDTSLMREGDFRRLFAGDNSFAVHIIKMYTNPPAQERKRTTAVADAYLCTTILQDTILVLDTNLTSDKVDPEIIVGAELKPAPGHERCIIYATAPELDRLMNYHYLYGSVTFGIED